MAAVTLHAQGVTDIKTSAQDIAHIVMRMGEFYRRREHKDELRLVTVSRLVQRLDGFISADAVWVGGELTTVPLVFAGRKLVLNVDTSAMGSARVELQDEQGQPLPGFSAADCDPIDGNFTARTVTWKGKAQVAAAEGKPVRLRFALRAAKLYAFQFLP